jgi:hypothetical protein
MANASRKHFGPGAQGKGDGSGAMSVRPDDMPENFVLSNRDKALHSDSRGLDSKWLQVEQRLDSEANQRSAADHPAEADDDQPEA